MSQGWAIAELQEPLPVPTTLLQRYPWMPDDFLEFVTNLDEAVRGDEQLWLLTSKDYRGISESAFAWKEWELQSLDAAREDSDWIADIQRFWNQHLPVVVSVNGGYGYFALRPDGSVASGREPELEDTTIVAGSYYEFIISLIN